LASNTRDALKRAAAESALSHVRSGMALGLGTGSTVRHLVDLLGEAVRSGALTDVVGVPSSIQTETQARSVGISLIGLADRVSLDLTIDGADEISPELHLMKGMGGALLREKMVAQASERVLIIADDSKVVDRLGTASPLPVEVVEWGVHAQVRFLERLGATVSVRTTDEGIPTRSDNGNLFLDCRFPRGLEDPHEVESRLRERAGVIETGLFLGIADEALIASGSGVRSVRGPVA
jgi:ribose 5-phosphate isomerase A